MAVPTIIFGVLLAALGGISYALAEVKSPTALIPTAFGAALIILGVLALYEKWRKHAMHIAAMIGLIGFVGGAVMGFPKLPALLSGDLTGRDLNKAQSQNMLAFLCLAFVLLCINSFVQARRRRRQAGADSTQVPK